MRSRRFAIPSVLLAAAALVTAPPAAAQLRPLDPMEWELFEEGRDFAASAGAGVHQDQRASLAGTEGRLVELGNFRAGWRSGRIAVEAAGTVRRLFDDERRFAPPADGVGARSGPHRADSGDYRLATAVLLTPSAWNTAAAALRFGARLPTTDNRVGLDRDQTDFFALVAGRIRAPGVRFAAETGVGIYGTRSATFEQSDLFLYALAAELPTRSLTPTAALLGQMDWSSGAPRRATEDLSELRLGLRAGSAIRLHAQLILGLADFSPSRGLLLSLGTAR